MYETRRSFIAPAGLAPIVAMQGGCGTCQILSDGPTAQSAFCSSFAPKS